MDHFAASEPFDIAGVDIYHPSQDDLTGIEIAFGGDMTRSLKDSNYLVLETQAQAFPHWTPYPGQLRLQAFSHLASGANMVAYWHWHSIHNSFETYWKGLLSHDLLPNPVYNEAMTIGADFERLSDELVNLRKTNKTAIMVSNEALTALEWFKLPDGTNYNDIVRALYDELYKLNVECDFIQPTSTRLSEYKLIIVPALYAVSDECLQRLNQYVREGGHVIYSFKSGFADEVIQVRQTVQPAVIHEACGVSYNMFVEPNKVGLKGVLAEERGGVRAWMELLTPTTAEVLAYYDHKEWGKYAAITRNAYGEGTAIYMGCLPSSGAIRELLTLAVKEAGLWGAEQELAFPIIVRSGVNESGSSLRYYFNYSGDAVSLIYPHGDGVELLSGERLVRGQKLELAPWGVLIARES
ncbi:Beta-galactosidase BgaB [compost metagenome]